jgi:hypothetical protein
MRFPQLHLRDLFWLVLVCALALGWWLERSRLIAGHVSLKMQADTLAAKSKWTSGYPILQGFASFLQGEGYQVEWHPESGNITIDDPSDNSTTVIYPGDYAAD